MVGQGDGGETGLGRQSGNLPGREGAVGGGGMYVQIDKTHDNLL